MNQRLAIAIAECDGQVEKVADNFGECSKFIVFEITPKKEVILKETFFNPLSGYENSQSQLPAYIKQYDVETIITGKISPKALAIFHHLAIDIIDAHGLEYEKALSLYLQGELKATH